MTSKPPAMVAVLICVLTLSALVACDNATEEAGGTQTPSASATIVSSPRTVTMREPDWWTPPAASVERLFVDHSVVVGAVTGVERPFDPATRSSCTIRKRRGWMRPSNSAVQCFRADRVM